MKLTFVGAVGTVTGSKYLLERSIAPDFATVARRV